MPKVIIEFSNDEDGEQALRDMLSVEDLHKRLSEIHSKARHLLKYSEAKYDDEVEEALMEIKGLAWIEDLE